jgi:hypothetical protein
VWSTTSTLKRLSTRSLFRWPTCTLGANDRLAEEEVRRAAAAVAEEEDRVGGETDADAEADSWKPAVAIGGVASADTVSVPGLLQRKLTHKRAEVEGRQGQDQGDGYGDSGGGGAAQEEAGWQAEAGPFGKPARAADTGTSLTAHRRDIANAILAARQDTPPGMGRVCV